MKAKPVFRKREGGILLIHESVCLYIHGLEVDVSGQWTLFKPIPLPKIIKVAISLSLWLTSLPSKKVSATTNKTQNMFLFFLQTITLATT